MYRLSQGHFGFFHLGFKFSSFVFLLANKRSGMSGGQGGYQLKKN